MLWYAILYPILNTSVKIREASGGIRTFIRESTIIFELYCIKKYFATPSPPTRFPPLKQKKTSAKNGSRDYTGEGTYIKKG